MLISFLNWIYVAITTYIVGRFTLPRVESLLSKDSHLRFNTFDYIISGFMIVTVYAGFFSIFHKVGVVANVLLLIICVIMIYADRKVYSNIKQMNVKREIDAYTIALFVVAVVSILASLMYTSNSTFHYDTGLYHAQAIRWIEEYGLVKGMGLLHFRLAYNSTYFPVCALYSFRDILGGQSLHALSGFIAEIVVLYAITGLVHAIKNHTFLRSSAVSDVLRFAPLLCWIVCCMELTSPETDFVVTFLFLWMCIRFAEISEHSDKSVVAYCLVALSSFSLIGYKLTSAVIALIVIYPLVKLIKAKDYKAIGICAAVATITMLPYLIRNFFISGWLIYPFSGIDIFNVNWKMPKEVLLGDAGAIKQGSQVGNNGVPEGVSMQALGWLRTWWNDNYLATRLFYSTVILALPTSWVILFYKIIRWIFRKDSQASIFEDPYLYIMAVLNLCLVYWFILGPAIRYGYSYVFTFPCIVVGYLMRSCHKVERFRMLSIVAAYGLAFVILLPTLKSIKPLLVFDMEETRARYDFSKTIVRQIDYPVTDPENVVSMDWNGETVYYPIEGDQMWYSYFISVPYENVYFDVKWVGDEISDGFCLE